MLLMISQVLMIKYGLAIVVLLSLIKIKKIMDMVNENDSIEVVEHQKEISGHLMIALTSTFFVII